MTSNELRPPTQVRRITHTVFEIAIPPHFKLSALILVKAFLDWLTTQTDVYVRSMPEIVADQTDKNILILRFRAGLDRNPNQQLPGQIYPSSAAYEELVELLRPNPADQLLQDALKWLETGKHPGEQVPVPSNNKQDLEHLINQIKKRPGQPGTWPWPHSVRPLPPDHYTKQEGGVHYLTMPIQPWEIIDANSLNYYEGCALKYIMRRKPGQNRVQELKKAVHYLEHLIKLEELEDAAKAKASTFFQDRREEQS